MGLGQGVGDTRRQIHANQEAVCGFRRVGGEMGPKGLPVLLILFEGGYHISILGSHFISWREFKGRANAEGGLRAGQGECWAVQGQGLRLKVVQGQGKCGGWFKGKANTEGGSRARRMLGGSRARAKIKGGSRARQMRRVVQGQGEYGARFKGKVNTKGPRANAGAIKKRNKRSNCQGHGGGDCGSICVGIHFIDVC